MGTMYARWHGSFDSGYHAKDNWETTAGARFRR
jgi:hypothetical protein